MFRTNAFIGLLALGTLAAAPAAAQEVATEPNDSWISLSGTVSSPKAESFMLDYGDGIVLVEMDDWDWYREGHHLIDGDKVTVYGRVDDDLFEVAKIEASAVYVQGLNSFFYASSADEEDLAHAAVVPVVVDSDLVLQGVVEAVNGREFTLDTGTGELTVDTSAMAYDPMDEEGFQRIEPGDLVRVVGDVDRDLFEEREIMAEAVVTLAADRG